MLAAVSQHYIRFPRVSAPTLFINAYRNKAEFSSPPVGVAYQCTAGIAEAMQPRQKYRNDECLHETSNNLSVYTFLFCLGFYRGWFIKPDYWAHSMGP